MYVDDVVLATNSESHKTLLFAAFDKKYGFKDGGILRHPSGKNDNGIWIHQENTARKCLSDMDGEAHGSATPMETNAKFKSGEESEDEEAFSFDYRAATGSLKYQATSTRPDTAFSMGYLSRFVSKPTKKHRESLKHILRYLISTSKAGRIYSARNEVTDKIVISGHCDADCGNNPNSRKSITGYMLTIAGGTLSWTARRQSITAMSTDEVNKTRHIELRWHYVREQIKKDHLQIYEVDGTNNQMYC
ncbi:Copiatype Polyprotein [Phytophthora palmivora]|uniref:Copiatype Polyprotein n=1 Tax=Phytophthora palmivora TaxID=4796 RepID=A0A2P4WZX5_9STRA|nr:Copiatype Polyprotein [Phytophthora palmivora]